MSNVTRNNLLHTFFLVGGAELGYLTAYFLRRPRISWSNSPNMSHYRPHQPDKIKEYSDDKVITIYKPPSIMIAYSKQNKPIEVFQKQRRHLATQKSWKKNYSRSSESYCQSLYETEYAGPVIGNERQCQRNKATARSHQRLRRITMTVTESRTSMQHLWVHCFHIIFLADIPSIVADCWNLASRNFMPDGCSGENIE